MTPLLSFSGLASGLDTARMIQGLVNAEAAPVRRLQRQKTDLGRKSAKLTDVRGLLDSLKSAAAALDTRAEVLLSTASSSDASAVAATASGGASLGTFSVEVLGLARAERTYSDAFASDTSAGLFGTGTLSLQVGSDAAVNVTVDATDTLQSVVSKINASGVRATAGILFDGTSYRLQVSGAQSGAANAITFTELGTTLGLTNPVNEKQAATDATFRVDGYDMTRSGNVVTDAVPGVTLDLKTTTTGVATVTVQRDPAALQVAVQGFVDAYNALAKDIDAEFVYSGQPRGGDSLSGDATLRSIQSRLRTEVSDSVPGLTPPYDRLLSLGVTTQSDGTLSLDGTKLAAALADDAEAVSKLLAGDAVAGITGLFAKVEGAVDDYIQPSSGILTVRIDGIGDRVADADKQIVALNLRLDKFESNLRQQFTALEQVMSMLQGQSSSLMALMGTLSTGRGA